MKKTILLLFWILLLGCNQNKQEGLAATFTEEDAYFLINTFLISELKESKDGDTVFWNEKQIRPPAYELTDYDCENDTFWKSMPPPPPPILSFADKNWNVEKIKDIESVKWKKSNLFFQNDDSLTIEKKWKLRFKNDYVHNVSYPIYNEKTKIALIKIYRYKPFLICGTGLQAIYFFKKEKDTWKMLECRYL